MKVSSPITPVLLLLLALAAPVPRAAAEVKVLGFDLSARLAGFSPCTQACLAVYAGITIPISQEMMWAVCDKSSFPAVKEDLSTCASSSNCPSTESFLIGFMGLVCNTYSLTNPPPAGKVFPIVPALIPTTPTTTTTTITTPIETTPTETPIESPIEEIPASPEESIDPLAPPPPLPPTSPVPVVATDSSSTSSSSSYSTTETSTTTMAAQPTESPFVIPGVQIPESPPSDGFGVEQPPVSPPMPAEPIES
ncbi:hypothetical protein HDU67_006552 [Dinochytrium kinnereticum]|nr:hypothetical protein HDU67_006552 [Dinochytrium kinnereticum]